MMRMVSGLFQRRDKLRTIYAYWQLPQSLQTLRADRQMSENTQLFASIVREKLPAAISPLSINSIEHFKTLFLLREAK